VQKRMELDAWRTRWPVDLLVLYVDADLDQAFQFTQAAQRQGLTTRTMPVISQTAVPFASSFPRDTARVIVPWVTESSASVFFNALTSDKEFSDLQDPKVTSSSLFPVYMTSRERLDAIRSQAVHPKALSNRSTVSSSRDRRGEVRRQVTFATGICDESSPSIPQSGQGTQSTSPKLPQGMFRMEEQTVEEVIAESAKHLSNRFRDLRESGWDLWLLSGCAEMEPYLERFRLSEHTLSPRVRHRGLEGVILKDDVAEIMETATRPSIFFFALQCLSAGPFTPEREFHNPIVLRQVLKHQTARLRCRAAIFILGWPRSADYAKALLTSSSTNSETTACPSVVISLTRAVPASILGGFVGNFLDLLNVGFSIELAYNKSVQESCATRMKYAKYFQIYSTWSTPVPSNVFTRDVIPPLRICYRSIPDSRIIFFLVKSFSNIESLMTSLVRGKNTIVNISTRPVGETLVAVQILGEGNDLRLSDVLHVVGPSVSPSGVLYFPESPSWPKSVEMALNPLNVLYERWDQEELPEQLSLTFKRGKVVFGEIASLFESLLSGVKIIQCDTTGVLTLWGGSLGMGHILSNVRFLYRALPSNDPRVLCSLGAKLQNGDTVNEDLRHAFLCFKHAAAKGSVVAQANLGMAYLNGRGTEVDVALGIKWLRRAASQGDPIAKSDLGYAYLTGNGVSKNHVLGIRLLWQAAMIGDRTAQCNLGREFESGVILRRNVREAAKWYYRAAEQGDCTAMVNLGDCFLHSDRGVQRSAETAVFWYKLSSDLGDALGSQKLAECCSNGIGIEKNYELALKASLLTLQQQDSSEISSNPTFLVVNSAIRPMRSTVESRLSREVHFTIPFNGSRAGVFAVMNGRGGRLSVHHCEEQFLPVFKKCIRGEPLAVLRALKRSFWDVDQRLLDKSREFELEQRLFTGCSLCTVVIVDGLLYCANVGDCRAILSRKEVEVVYLSDDHIATLRPDESERIREAGGYVNSAGVNGVVNLSRSLGFFDLKNFKAEVFPAMELSADLIISEPEVTVNPIGFDAEFVILGTNAFWLQVKPDEAVRVARTSLLRHRDPRRCAERLAKLVGNPYDHFCISVVLLDARTLCSLPRTTAGDSQVPAKNADTRGGNANRFRRASLRWSRSGIPESPSFAVSSADQSFRSWSELEPALSTEVLDPPTGDTDFQDVEEDLVNEHLRKDGRRMLLKRLVRRFSFVGG